MDNIKVAEELVKLAKEMVAVSGDDSKEINTLFGKVAVDLVALEDGFRKMMVKGVDKKKYQEYKKVYNAIQYIIDVHDKADDMWGDLEK